jgi:CHRD domain
MKAKRLLILRNSLFAFVSTVGLAQAAIVEFDLSPTGTSPGVGLSPANETPPVVGSTGSGNEISGGIFFDTVTSTLSFAMGYGSSAGFTNLTGAATSLHIHGPAAVGVAALPLFDLATVHFPAAVPANGGIIFGSVLYTPAQAADLLAGLDYVNIHTVANSAGEIRGQLIRQNAAPDVIPPVDATVECGVPVTFSATVSDFDGDAVQAVWTLNGVPVETDPVAAGGPPSSAVITYTAALHDEGANTLSVIATDSAGNITTASATITVVDTTPPVIVAVSADPKVLWPPNHKMVPVTVRAKVTDACGHTAWEILSVSSNQAVDEKGSGNTSPDWKITGDHTVSLRAERSGKIKSDRVYFIKIQATDEAGNKSETSTVRVTVPHDQGKN